MRQIKSLYPSQDWLRSHFVAALGDVSASFFVFVYLLVWGPNESGVVTDVLPSALKWIYSHCGERVSEAEHSVKVFHLKGDTLARFIDLFIEEKVTELRRTDMLQGADSSCQILFICLTLSRTAWLRVLFYKNTLNAPLPWLKMPNCTIIQPNISDVPLKIFSLPLGTN